MTACTGRMLRDRWAPDRGGVRDVYADFNSLTFDITIEALFGSDVATGAEGKALTDSIREAFEHFTQRAASGFVVPEWVPTPNNLQYNGAVRRLDRYIFAMIARRRAELQSRGGAAGASDLLTALIEARDDDGTTMADGPLRDELMTLLIAGQETSAIMMGWVCACLAWHPGAQAAAAAEVEVRSDLHCTFTSTCAKRRPAAN